MVPMAQNLEEFICYDEFWLDKDMENMGYLFEYCEAYCREILGDEQFLLDKEMFIESFMKSDCRALMEIGHPTLLSQAAYDTAKDFIEVDNEKRWNPPGRNPLKAGKPLPHTGGMPEPCAPTVCSLRRTHRGGTFPRC